MLYEITIDVTILSFILWGKIRIFFNVAHIFVVKGLKYAPLLRVKAFLQFLAVHSNILTVSFYGSDRASSSGYTAMGTLDTGQAWNAIHDCNFTYGEGTGRRVCFIRCLLNFTTGHYALDTWVKLEEIIITRDRLTVRCSSVIPWCISRFPDLTQKISPYSFPFVQLISSFPPSCNYFSLESIHSTVIYFLEFQDRNTASCIYIYVDNLTLLEKKKTRNYRSTWIQHVKIQK